MTVKCTNTVQTLFSALLTVFSRVLSGILLSHIIIYKVLGGVGTSIAVHLALRLDNNKMASDLDTEHQCYIDSVLGLVFVYQLTLLQCLLGVLL